jgi:hypothetical protein
MKKPKEYFDLDLDTLRVLGAWAADCAERALPIFEEANPRDPRPRAAIEGTRAFAGGGKRTARLRTLAMEAFRAARETADPAASAAAQAASLAAASAYTHPLAASAQTKHILGPAAFAALAVEIRDHGDSARGEKEARLAAERARPEIRALLRKMPARAEGRSRADEIMRDLDSALRSKDKS